MLFSVRRDGKVSKHEAIFRPPRTKKEHADAIFRPCGLKSVLKALFSVPRDGKVSKPEAIFRPPLTKKVDYMTLFSFCHGRMKIVTDGKWSLNFLV